MITLFITLSIISLTSAKTTRKTESLGKLAIPRPKRNENTKAVVTPINGGISITKKGFKALLSVTDKLAVKVSESKYGNVNRPVKYDNNPEKIVIAYAKIVVNSNIFPALPPMSDIAVTTKPIIISGTQKDRN